MLLVLRALLVLGLATLLHASGKGQAVSLRLGQGVRPRSKTVRLILDPSLRPQMASTSTSTIANMSLSPWMYRDSYVASRLPQRISHAHCLTVGCLGLPGGGENAALEAKPIYYQALVLHRVRRPWRTKNGGRKMKNRYDFRLGMEMITVGCTCVRPSVVPQQ